MPLEPIIVVYFIYGLSFFSLGLAVGVEAAGHVQDAAVRRAVAALSFFGVVHGLHEWYEMFLLLAGMGGDRAVPLAVSVLRVLTLVTSFTALYYFSVIMLNRYWPRIVKGLRFAIPGLFAVGLLAASIHTDLHWNLWLAEVDRWARYSLAFPSAVLSGIAMLESGHARAQEHERLMAFGWRLAGIGFILYGLVGQTVVAPGGWLLPAVYNTDVFYRMFGIRVQVFRAASALMITTGLIAGLRAVEERRRRQLEAANTARMEAQEQASLELQRREALQAELLHRTIAAQEEERAHIARELHDEIGQTLTALRMGVDALSTSVAQGTAVSSDQVEGLHRLARQALAELKKLVTDLRPAQLDHLGLVAAIYWLGDQARERLGLDTRIEVIGKQKRLCRDAETALFRIAQEALTNTARHAQVNQITVQLTYRTEEVELTISDSGIGFDQQVFSIEKSHTAGWGIAGMAERASAVGGSLVIESRPGQGTKVRAVVPVCGDETASREVL
mgnify:CR=1 FL=1